MKKTLLLIALLFGTAIFAQGGDIVAVPTLWDTIVTIFVPAILAQTLVLFADAKKYYSSEIWSWSIFFGTKIKPFLITTFGGVALYVILQLVPTTQPFIEIFVGSPIASYSAAALFGAAAAIVDGFTKKSK
jgi:hypothetical protein